MDSIIESHLSNLEKFLNDLSAKDILQLSSVINQARINKKTIYTLGNGGSATTALHMANDFSTICDKDNNYLKVRCLNANISTFSAIANDFGYDKVFSRQIDSLLEPNDIVIGISASGNSQNCVEALTIAKMKGAVTIGLLGFDGGIMKNYCDHSIHIKINDYFIVESLHLIVSHALTLALKSINHFSV